MMTFTRQVEFKERLADLEHEQWMKWAGTVMPEVSSGRQARWQEYMVPYEELTEKVKDYDRKWADKILKLIDEFWEEED